MSDTESMDGDVYQPCLDISTLPQVVKNRVKALKKLQMGVAKAEVEYYKEVHQLDVKYQRVYDQINKQRADIVSGKHEPAGDEIDWPSDDEEEDAEEKLTNGVDKIALTDYTETTVGIPKFWLHAFKTANEESLMGLVEPHDEAVLEYLSDITVALNTPDNTGFTLTFHWREGNPYFTNPTLTKTYILRDGPDPEDPLAYDGPEIVSCKGCKIDWVEGQDVTKTTMKVKKVKARKAAKGSPEKAITKEITADSFFNFFSPPEVSEDGKDEVSGEDQALLAIDFDVGFAIKEKIIPRAILYFTGEAFDDDDFEDIDDEEDDEEED